MHRRSFWAALCAGLFIGGAAVTSIAYADKREPPPASANFDIVDTEGSAFLLDRSTGDVWRLSFTQVKGDRYWFGTHVPLQQPGTFEGFRNELLRKLNDQR